MRGRILGVSSRVLAVAGFAVAASACVAEAEVGARVSVARRLGVVTRGSCAVAPLVRDVGAGCEPVSGRVEVAPALDEGAARAAFDLDVCRSWNAGSKGPVSVGLDFGTPKRVAAVMLMPSDGGQASHVIEASDDGATWRQLVVVRGELAGGQAYAVVLPEPVTTTRLRVTTTESAAPVAWREIVPLDC